METTMIEEAKTSSSRRIQNLSEFPELLAEVLERRKDPKAYDRRERRQEQRELQKLWNEEMPEFKRLERLSIDLKIKRVIVTPNSPSNISGRYLPEGDWESDLAEKWGLSERQENSILKSGPTILICRDAVYEEGVCRFLAHEIGHHICHLAKFTPQQLNAPVTNMMRRFFLDNAYLQKHNSHDEFLAECFAEYLTVFALRRAIERECEAVLSRLLRRNPGAAKLVRQYRTTLLERAS